ncbi:hypothetical protein HWV62_10373 [Athelia sp. TMB]|nr:hypothetical protein HWV62_10373 [Athelia sp. TMB]
MKSTATSRNAKLVFSLDALEDAMRNTAYHLSRALNNLAPISSACSYRTSSAALRRASRKASTVGIIYAPPPSARARRQARTAHPSSDDRSRLRCTRAGHGEQSVELEERAPQSANGRAPEE